MFIIGRFKDYYSRVMDLPDAPTKVARGAALGLALDFLPLPIISIPVAYVLARVLGGNGLAGALTAAFFKWAVPFFYVMNVATGSLILGFKSPETAVVATVTGTIPADWWGNLTNWLASLGPQFLVGAAINAFLAWLVLFFLARRFLMIRQMRKGMVISSKNDNK